MASKSQRTAVSLRKLVRCASLCQFLHVGYSMIAMQDDRPQPLVPCRLVTLDSAAAAASNHGRGVCSQTLRQHCSSAMHQSTTHSVQGGVQAATASTRCNTSGACFPSWLPPAPQPLRTAGSVAQSGGHARQMAWVSRGIVHWQHSAAPASRPLMLLLRQRQYSTAAQLASSSTSWRSAARRIAFQRLQVCVVVLQTQGGQLQCPGRLHQQSFSSLHVGDDHFRCMLVRRIQHNATWCTGDTGTTAADHVCGPRGSTNRQRCVLQGQPRAAAVATVRRRDGTARQVCCLPCRAQHL